MIKTPRFALLKRVIRQRFIKNLFIITNHVGSPTVTTGKAYKVLSIDSYGYIHAESDIDMNLFCAPVGAPCCHLNKSGRWQYLTK